MEKKSFIFTLSWLYIFVHYLLRWESVDFTEINVLLNNEQTGGSAGFHIPQTASKAWIKKAIETTIFWVIAFDNMSCLQYFIWPYWLTVVNHG